ncbi:hypothetical protein INR49_007822 [Caranx melampygus]|nr:hypothetical protein INR49_007822 [Caranx melampygus]
MLLEHNPNSREEDNFELQGFSDRQKNKDIAGQASFLQLGGPQGSTSCRRSNSSFQRLLDFYCLCFTLPIDLPKSQTSWLWMLPSEPDEALFLLLSLGLSAGRETGPEAPAHCHTGTQRRNSKESRWEERGELEK